MCLCVCVLFLFVVLGIYNLIDLFFFFFFNDTATTEIYTLSLHDALPIPRCWRPRLRWSATCPPRAGRSEEHTSELQSRGHLVCRLLLEKKKKKQTYKEYNKHKKKNERTHNCRTIT